MMRYFLALLLLVAGAAGAYLVYLHVTAGPAVVLPPPQQLEVSSASGSLLSGGWTNSSTIYLSAVEARGTTAGADVEIRPSGKRFTGKPNALVADPAATTHTTSPLKVHLADGSYHWQLRLHNNRGISPWKVFKGTINIDTYPPAPPQISSATNPDPAKLYHSSTVSFAWQGTDLGSGIAGYSYRLDTDAHGTARAELRTSGTSVSLHGLNTGSYFFHVRALDRAGNWGPTATFPARVDVTPPGFATMRFSDFQFDPQFTPLQVTFAVTRPAKEVRVGVYRQSDGRLIRLYHVGPVSKGRQVSVTWHGKDAGGRQVAAGAYEVFVRATDRYGHSNLQGWRDFIVNYQHIVISLGQQRLWAYDGRRLILTSLVTTGNRALPTPTGTYHIMAKFHPFTFHSPWPKTSQFYYPPSKVVYAMLFRAGGYFIHDAPWRSAFGPGTNAQAGTPGTNYTGTHGCVNTPPDIARALYGWTQIGTVVQVVN
ncbi:MAG: L,D-transpeptidase family protein [Chloroflexota bacterium]|nr:L,D-transpeptidase family protein [Chloroflexota bacterium]